MFDFIFSCLVGTGVGTYKKDALEPCLSKTFKAIVAGIKKAIEEKGNTKQEYSLGPQSVQTGGFKPADERDVRAQPPAASYGLWSEG
mmetsp:Transcript_31018/g.81556  ORF Transcript_31018/g.81556 Transcript_31018/m.81556 type:complete len:87 (-) Transcript_31018:132-392(-)